jgi:hypothetical protein
MSAAGRRRIAEAQKKRWAAMKGEAGNAEPSVSPASSKPKRKISAAGRRAIGEATRKRWAAFHAAKKEATKKTTARRLPAKKSAVKSRRMA